jgi:transcriptional regulator with XRE-family HTH domain
MNHLKRARVLADLSQQELAEASGISRQSISNLERGVTRGHASTYRVLASALGVDVGDLIEEEDTAKGHRQAAREEAV